MGWSPLLLLLLMCACARANMYMHTPRGSNNRLNENSHLRRNNNRLFNSQNNNKGGYNVGDKSKSNSVNQDEQYNMKYFQSDDQGGKTYLEVEWTNQHGCGDMKGDETQKRHCQLVLQYMCMDDIEEEKDFEKDTIRNGRNTYKQGWGHISTSGQISSNAGKAGQVRTDRGLHETWDWYKQCYIRKANGGLFLADQVLQNTRLGYSAAIHTRQNSEGDRSGYECDEERDYWPYWAASPWVDVAVLTSDTQRCELYKATSTNIQTKGRCFQEKFQNPKKPWMGKVEVISKYIDGHSCESNGGEWHEVSSYIEKAGRDERECSGKIKGTDLQYVWRIPYDVQYEDNGLEDVFSSPYAECLVVPGELDCQQADFSRVNHLGNTKDGQMMRYKWELPYFPSNEPKRCVFRMRYNISSYDYDPKKTDSDQNGEESPVKNNPVVTPISAGDNKLKLKLAINTAQFGRTFQDRSHVFKLLPRTEAMLGRNIYNLNVRGRRGNIVQTFPSVEYDFTPADLLLTTEDLLMVQWTGSNNNPNDNGIGKARTDRSNLVFVDAKDIAKNVPTTFEDFEKKLYSIQAVWNYFDAQYLTPMDIYVMLASSGYYRCLKKNSHACKTQDGSHQDDVYYLSKNDNLDDELDNAPASFKGVVLRFWSPGKYYFMCTRNNQFSNREQKGSITVLE